MVVRVVFVVLVVCHIITEVIEHFYGDIKEINYEIPEEIEKGSQQEEIPKERRFEKEELPLGSNAWRHAPVRSDGVLQAGDSVQIGEREPVG